MLRLLAACGLTLILAQPVYAGATQLKDEGTSKGYTTINNCVGGGIVCTKSGRTGTYTVNPAGGGFDPWTGDNSETMDNSVDDFIEWQGVGGADDTDLRLDLDGTHPIFDSPTDSKIGFADTVEIKSQGSSVNSIEFTNDGNVVISAADKSLAGVSIEYLGGTGIGGSAGGGSVNLTGGTGGTQADFGKGGAINLFAGNGAIGGGIDVGAGVSSAGKGADVSFTAGNAVGGNRDGGNITFTMGNASGSGTDGLIRFFIEGGTTKGAFLGLANLTQTRTYTFPDVTGEIQVLTAGGATPESITNATDDFVVTTGVGGTDNTDIRWDLDGTHPILDSPTDTKIEIAEILDVTNVINTSIGLDAIGAVDLDYGSADVTDHTFVTDSTGDGEMVLPNNSIGPAEMIDASSDASGDVELATAAETTTGTDATRAVTPDGLAGSDYGKRVAYVILLNDTNDTVIKDGSGDIEYTIPAIMNGYNLVDIECGVFVAGTTNTTDIQVHNVTDTADMLSTVCTIDSTELNSHTAAAPPVIDGMADDVATADRIRFDVDAVSTTAAKGLWVELTFQNP